MKTQKPADSGFFCICYSAGRYAISFSQSVSEGKSTLLEV